MIVRRGLALGAVGVGVAVLASCTGDRSGPTVTTTTTVASAATTSAKPVPPALPASAGVPTTKGAAEFFRHFVDLYNYGFHELDTQPLLAVSAPQCDFCQGSAQTMSGAAARGYTNIGGELTVTTVVAAPGDPSSGLLVNAVVDQDAGSTKDADGKTVGATPARKNVRIDARAVWIQDHWQMRAARVLEGADH